MTEQIRIAMWSGPRNISTAMLRSWGNRQDTWVVDEPLYAHYLSATGVEHPGREAILRAHETDWRRVVQMLTGPIPAGRRIFYQKHMSHHLLPGMDTAWVAQLRNAFLIRHPREMLPSLAKVLGAPKLADTGLPQQIALFEQLTRSQDGPPPVVDARDVLTDPEARLGALCAALDVSFDPAMLAWPAGGRETDGVWAPYWYGSVEQSTGFAPYRPKRDSFPEALEPLLTQCEPLYARLAAHRL